MSKIQNFDYSVDLLQSIIWQYNEAEHLIKIIEGKQKRFNENVTDEIKKWFNDVFNIDTATDFGLNVWARILNVNFSIKKPDRTDGLYWGFGQYRRNFSNGNFHPPKDNTTELNLTQKRMILKLTYFKYHILPSVPEINKVIRTLIDKNSYIEDGFDMSSNLVVFRQQIPRDIQYILDNFDILPRPAGVGIKTAVITGREFGFGKYRGNFAKNCFFGKTPTNL